MKTMRFLILIALASMLANAPLQAALLDLTNPGGPDLLAGYLDVSFNATSGTFLASGYTVDYQNGSVSLSDAGDYTLTANITPAGVLSGGSLTIQGDLGSGTETLLTGTLTTGPGGTAFGFQDPSEGSPRNIFEFLFTVTGGDAAVVQDFGGGGGGGAVILDAAFQDGGTPFSGYWTTSFHNVGNGSSAVSDNFAVPEPSTASLLLMVGGALWVAARCACLRTVPRP